MKQNKDTIKYCKHCFGIEPCWCDKKEYVTTWKFVYDFFRRLKP